MEYIHGEIWVFEPAYQRITKKSVLVWAWGSDSSGGLNLKE